MEENSGKGLVENHLFLIAATIFILIMCAAGMSLINLKNSPPAVSGVKIIHKENKIILSYRRSDPDGPDKKDSIAWFFNNKHEKEYDGLRLIPVPAVLGATVEVSCAVTAYDGIDRSPQVKSNIVKYFQGSPNAAEPADTEAGPSGAHAASRDENAANDSAGNADTGSGSSSAVAAGGNSENSATADNSINISGGDPGLKNTGADPGGSPGESVSAGPEKQSAAGRTPEPSAGGDDKNVEPAPLFGNKPAEIFKDNSTKKEQDAFETPYDNAPAEYNSYPPYIPYPPYVPYPPYPQYSGRSPHYRHHRAGHRQTPAGSHSNEVYGGDEDENKHATRLHTAARRDDVHTAAELLKKGADIDARDNDGVTPLHTAILNNSMETARFLVNSGADIKARDNTGKTPLHVAARKKSKIITLLLFEKESVTVDKVKDPHLVKINRLVNITDNRGQTALHAAAAFDAGAVASILIDSGADVNARDQKKSTPLHYALLNKSRSVVPLLLSSGADLGAKDEFGQKPEHFADEEMKSWLMPKDTAENPIKKHGK